VVCWIEIFKSTKKKLDRELQQQEIEFLKWVYERHKEEKEAELKTDS